MAKGQDFERSICVLLSKWWTKGKRDDVFWRTSGSGARATTRKKKGKSTYGQYGDICATDPIGQPLIDLLTIELKRGYSKESIFDLMDGPDRKSSYGEWIQKLASHSDRWMLIVKRDRRIPFTFLPYKVIAGLIDNPEDLTALDFFWDGVLPYRIFGLPLEDFMRHVTARRVRELAKMFKEDEE